MSIIAPYPSTAKPAKIECYIDTFVAHFRKLPKGTARKLHAMQQNVFVDNSKSGWGVMVRMQQPQHTILRELQKFDGTISRLDLAFDWHDTSLEWVHAHLLLKRRKAEPLLQIKASTYSTPHGEQADRDCLTYNDKESKLWSTPNAVHQELRLRGRAIASSRIETIADIFELDPSVIFRKHFRVTSFDAIEFKNRLLREMLQEERDRHLKRNRNHREGSAEDQYRANLIRRIEGTWDRVKAQYQHAQRVHDQFPQITMTTNMKLISLPKTLTWGASSNSFERRPHVMGEASLIELKKNDVDHDNVYLSGIPQHTQQ